MSTTNKPLISDRQRSTLNFSEERRRDGLLRTSWNQIVSAFKPKPEPRSVWYETATGDTTPWARVVVPIRAALLAAVQSGDRQLIASTLEGARAFCRELEADFASLVPQSEEESITAIALDETHLEGPANEVQAQLIANPSPTNADRAVLPLERQRNRIDTLISRCRRAARQAPATMVAR